MQNYRLNEGWLFAPDFQPEMVAVEYDDRVFQPVTLPHTIKEVPFNYFDEKIYQMTACYRKTFVAPQDWLGKAVLLCFEGVAHQAEVYVNGQLVAAHHCGYTAFYADIAPCLQPGGEVVVAVKVDSRETLNQPPFGGVVDYLAYGGIYREVFINVGGPVYLDDVFISTPEVLSANKKVAAAVELAAGGPASGREQLALTGLRLEAQLLDSSGNEISRTSAEWGGQTVNLLLDAPGVTLWEVEQPTLYSLRVALYQHGNLQDSCEERFGFREAVFRADGFYLNGNRIKLLGLNRHQCWPYVGYAMPRRPQQLDADLLKNQLGLDAVRTAHYPQSRHFINRCDEIGLLVFTEIPGWQHIGDDEWKNHAVDATADMVRQYRNHPSIILWGVRINESEDDDEFYTRTNQVAHSLDPTRQTGGVRFIRKSHLLEDVYTYNDFLHNGTTPGLAKKQQVTPNENAPYLVTEYNGHMFPTKSYDNEEHRLEHARRHARVLSAMYSGEGVSGCFGWCMFDYNTHKDFGSGDGVCYHGVMDMFRNPKMAAAVYASQQSQITVLEISSTMNIGEHPSNNIGDVYAFTNADSVRLYKDGQFVKEFYPAAGSYPGMPRPPIIIDDMVGELIEKNEPYSHAEAEQLKQILKAASRYGPDGMPLKYKLKTLALMMRTKMGMDEGVRLFKTYVGNWGGAMPVYRFEAIKGGQVCAAVERGPLVSPAVTATADTSVLTVGDGYDVATIWIKAVAPDGTTLTYLQEPVVLSVSGPVEIVGPKLLSLRGGMCGSYLRTTGQSGTAMLEVDGGPLGRVELAFTVEQAQPAKQRL